MSRRERFLRRLPVAFQTCSFEVLIGLLCSIVGVTVVTGAVEPGSLLSYLPHGGLVAWGIGMLAGGLTTLSGLPGKTYPILLAAGLSLTGPLLGAYSVAVIAFAGWSNGGLSGIFFGAVALLCGFRALYLGAIADTDFRARENGVTA